MKEGKTLTQLAQELERQLETRKDYLAQTGAINMKVQGEAKTPVIDGLNGDAKGITPFAHGQMAQYLGIPKRYYDRMRDEAPELLAENVNNWLHEDPKAKRLVRTLDGNVRAFLSDRYRPLDNYDLASHAIPILHEKDTRIVSAELTERRLYIKAILPSLETEVKGSKEVNDIVQAGIVISNSEIGAGSIKVEPLIYRLVCKNGMIAPDAALRKYHVGRGFAEIDGVEEFLTDATRKADDKAFWMKVRDVIRGAFNRDIFETLVNRMSEAAGNEIKSDDIPKVVEVAASRFSIGEVTQKSVLKNLIQDGDLTQWGMVNAITKVANTTEDYEQATELERIGGQVLELNRSEWETIAA